MNQTRSPFNATLESARLWTLHYKKTGRSSSSVQVRLLRFWEARNVRRGGDLMGVDMLLLDTQKRQSRRVIMVLWRIFYQKAIAEVFLTGNIQRNLRKSGLQSRHYYEINKVTQMDR
ncbi:hypothetical protein Bca4012_058290 [Brassica carinata]